MKLTVISLLLCLPLGCAYANPRTELRAGPFGSLFQFHDSKDNDITIKGAEYNPDTQLFKIEELTIRNNASDVRTANVEQMKAHAEQIRAMSEIVSQLSNVVKAVVPLIIGQGETSNGGPVATTVPE